jgi:hypothetical protein
MASSAAHFLFDATASLVALDESGGLLNFRTAFRFFEPQKEVSNAPIFLTFLVCARILQVLVSIFSLKLREHTLSQYRYDMSFYAYSALLSRLLAWIARGTLQWMEQMISLQFVQTLSPYCAA